MPRLPTGLTGSEKTRWYSQKDDEEILDTEVARMFTLLGATLNYHMSADRSTMRCDAKEIRTNMERSTRGSGKIFGSQQHPFPSHVRMWEKMLWRSIWVGGVCFLFHIASQTQHKCLSMRLVCSILQAAIRPPDCSCQYFNYWE